MDKVIVDGAETFLSNDRDKIKYAVWLKLSELGWHTVYNEISGHYEKNGFVLSLYLGKKNPVRESSSPGVRAGAVEYFHVPRSSWHLERYGALIASGRLSTSLSYVFDSECFEDSEFKEFIQKVNGYTEMENYMLAQHKQIDGYIEQEVEKPTVAASDKGVLDTGIFFIKNKDSGIVKYLNAGSFYVISSVIDSGILFSEIDEHGAYIGAPILMPDKSLFVNAVKNGDLQTLELIVRKSMEKTPGVISLTNARVAVVPDEIQRINFPDWQLKEIGAGISEMADVSPLLRSDLTEPCMQFMHVLIRKSHETNLLYKAAADPAVLSVLADAAEAGFSLHKYVTYCSSADEIKLFLMEDINNFDMIFDEMRSKYAVSTIDAVRFISTSAFSRVNIPEGCLKQQVFLQQNIQQGIMRSTAGILCNKGVQNEFVIYCNYSELDTNAKMELRSYFSDDLFMFCGHPWAEYYDELLGSVNYIAYDWKLGFLLSFPKGFWGRSSFGFFILDNNTQPVYRSIKLNGSYIEYFSGAGRDFIEKNL